jgi:hypothetical protein
VDSETLAAFTDRFTLAFRGVDAALLRPEADVARMGRTLLGKHQEKKERKWEGRFGFHA